MDFKLGKLPARKGAVTMKFSSYFDRDALPTPPKKFSHRSMGSWDVLANDKYACCVFSGAAHEHVVWSYMGGAETRFNDKVVLDDYAAVTGFRQDDPDSDVGTDMSAAAAYRRKTGVLDSSGVRRRIDSYLALRPGNLDDALVATYLTGACGIGLQLPVSAIDQFEKAKPWEVKRGSAREGGHYVSLLGVNSAGNLLVVTWGRIHAMTPAFFLANCDEALAYLSLDILRDRVSPEGFDEPALRANLSKLKPTRGAI